MSKLEIVKGTTSKLLRIWVPDSSSTTGAGLTGLTSLTVGMNYNREGDSFAIPLNLVPGTTGTWEDGGFSEISALGMPGWYEVGAPDAMLADGVDSVIAHFLGAGAGIGANMAPVPVEIQLIDAPVTVADVKAQCDQALADIFLDELISAPAVPGNVANASIIARMTSQALLANFSTYENQTDSLEALADAAATVATAAEITDAVWDEPVAGHVTPGTFGVNLDGTVSSRATPADVDTALAAIFLDKLMSAIQLPGEVANGSVMAQLVSAAFVPDWTDFDNQTQSLGAIAANTADIPTQLLTAEIETSTDLQESLRLVLSSCVAKLDGAGTGVITIRDLNDTKNRITATVDGIGNRTGVVTDKT